MRSSPLRTRLRSRRQPSPPPPTPPSPAPIDIDTSNALDQAQSPLFSAIPPEIRNEIFRLALREYVDPEQLYERESYWKRPGFEGPTRMDAALLRVCKRVWGETRDMLGKDCEPVFYLGSSNRAPNEFKHAGPGWQRNIHVHPSTLRMPPAVFASLSRIHVFAQMYAIADALPNLYALPNVPAPCGPADAALSKLTLTIRYTDWWSWEDDAPIHPIASANLFVPMREMLLPPFVTALTVRFENTVARMAQLDGVVDEMFARREWWVWTRRDGRRLLVKGNNAKDAGAVKEWRWMGPTSFVPGEAAYPHHGGGDSMEFVVKEVTWEVEAE